MLEHFQIYKVPGIHYILTFSLIYERGCCTLYLIFQGRYWSNKVIQVHFKKIQTYVFIEKFHAFNSINIRFT